MLKTHVDVFDTWSKELAAKLRLLADKHGALQQLGGSPDPLPSGRPVVPSHGGVPSETSSSPPFSTLFNPQTL